MTAQLRDYYVAFHREEYVAGIAMHWREIDDRTSRPDFNIVSFVEDALANRLNRNKGKLHIEFFDMQSETDIPAFVTIDPLTLHIDAETWSLAKIGEPFARFVIAHEIGHIVLHGHYEKAAFSNSAALRLKAFVKENSAEWQANTFADYFLLPTSIVSAFGSPAAIVAACSVPLDLAERRFAQVREERLCRKNSGDYCPTCGQLLCFAQH
jgi:hypothetical protein